MGARLFDILLPTQAEATPAVEAAAPAPLAADWGRLKRWLLVLAGVLLLALFLRPMSVSLDGQRRLVPRGTTVGQAAAWAGISLRPGDIVDVRGLTLRPGAGRPAVIYRDGQPVSADAPLRRGDALAIIPGQQVMEPHHEHAHLRDADRRGYRPSGVVGVRRTLEGEWSGRQVTYLVPAMATIRSASAPGRVLALTFDDGPWPTTTSQILATLKRYNARATFFVLGQQVRSRTALVRQALQQGCEIGIHSWSHPQYTRLSSSAIRADLARCEAVLRPLLGERVRYVRPPYGATNGRVAGAIQGAGYRQVMWSLDTNDWRQPGANTIASRILTRAHDGAIVLCHDGGGYRTGTVAAISRVVPALQARGYELVTLTELYSYKPGATGGAIVLADGRRLAVTPAPSGLLVEVDGQTATLPEAPVELDNHLVLPLRPTCELLGVTFEWNQEAQTVKLTGARTTLTVRINSLQVERANGDPKPALIPPILYRGRVMIPLPLLLEASGATAVYDGANKVLKLTTPAGLLQGGQAGFAEPPAVALSKSWTTQYSWAQ